MDKDALVTEDELPPVDDDLAGRADLRGVLLAAGLSAEAFDLAEGDGTLPLLAIEHLVLPEPATYDLSELSDVTGMPASQIAQLWRSLGFAEPQPGDRIFTSADAEMLHTVAGFLEMGAIDPGLVVQMSRVIGSSLARVASAQIDAIDAGSADEDALDADDGDAIDRDDAADSSSHTADETADQRRRAVDSASTGGQQASIGTGGWSGLLIWSGSPSSASKYRRVSLLRWSIGSRRLRTTRSLSSAVMSSR